MSTNDLLAAIYATSTDGTKWQNLCDVLNRHLASPIMFFAHKIGSDESLGIMGGGIDPSELQRYHQNFADKNAWMHMNVAMPVGMVGLSDQALSQRDLFQTEFYNDWLRHQENIVGGPAMICHRGPESFAALALACTGRDYEEKRQTNARVLGEIGPHIIRSIEMSKVLRNGSPSGIAHLDAMNKAVILIHRSGRSGFLNKAAERFLQSARALAISPCSRLKAADDNLDRHIRTVVLAMREQNFASLPLPAGLETEDGRQFRVHAHIFPDTCEQPFPASSWSDPVVGAFVVSGDESLESRDHLQRLVQSFGATAAEARLGEAILTGRTLYEYADETGVSRHTVRNQMRSLLLKTNSVNQTDFVGRLMRLASPF